MAITLDYPPRYLRVFTDASHCDGIAAAGWVIFASWDVDFFLGGEDSNRNADVCGTLRDVVKTNNIVRPIWHKILTAGTFLGSSTIVNAVLSAIESAIAAVTNILL
jgi:hypothetical protein